MAQRRLDQFGRQRLVSQPRQGHHPVERPLQFTGVLVGRVHDGHQHGDLGVDSDGNAELFLQYTGGSVSRLAHHRSSSCGDWVQPRATMSRDGRYVAFASDREREPDRDDMGRGDPYIIDLLADIQWHCVYLPSVNRHSAD